MRPYLSGPDVELVQRAIASLGIPITLDGIFGPGTQVAVETFQQRYGLLADGVVGPKTLTKLLSTPPTPVRF
ncbi:MAG: peptidoglycan-binding protein [Leptolyngbya sp. SIO4C1]|nr:peptidoglycan-binding protein [Leptolyngbya sp. SIO4C1]